MSAEKKADGLGAPGDHGPLAGQVNPFLSGITREQSSQCESEWNRETRVAGVEVRGMDDHLRILQQRVKAVAVHAGEGFESAAGVDGRKRLEGVLNEIVQSEEENLHAGHHHADVRHQFAILIAIGDKNREGVAGKEPTPKKK